jgi:hypothetical protein
MEKQEPIKLKPTVDREVVSREGVSRSTGSDYDFHRDVMEGDANDNGDNHRE